MFNRLKAILFPQRPLTAQLAVRQLFSNHGVETRESAGWLLTNGGFPKITASLAHVTKREDDVFTQLDVRVAIDDRSIVVESFSDAGPDSNEAIRRSLINFATSSLHVLLSSFWNRPQDDQVIVELWKSRNAEWQAHIGAITRKRSNNGHDVLPPKALMPLLETLIGRLHLNLEAHWLRVFFANLGQNDDTIIEVLLDNDPWEQAQSEIAELDWAVRDHYYSARVFVVLQPSDNA